MNPSIEMLLPALAALGIGLLIGLEREFRQRHEADVTHPAETAGIRTFALTALLAHLLTWLPLTLMPWALLIGFIALAGLVFIGYRRSSKGKKADIGMTTEMALLLTYVLGALTGLDYVLPATMIAIVVFALLSYKKLLHRFSHSLSPMDMRQTLQFLIITAVVLPILPDQDIGPFAAFNPQHIWLMVVLISGIGFVAYAAIKVFGHKLGLGLTGLLGGLVSSTAVTLAMSRLATENPRLHTQCMLAVLLACTMMFPRIWILTLLFNPGIAVKLALPVLLIVAAALIIGILLWRGSARHESPDKNFSPELNPLSLRMALGFAAFFGVVMLLVHAAQYYFGNAGILTVAALSGLSDVDAITLSLSQMDVAELATLTAVQGVMIASAANSAVKLGIGLTLAPSGARGWLLAGLGPMIAISLLTAAFIQA